VLPLARKAAKATALMGGILTRRRRGDVVFLLYHRVGDRGGEIELPQAMFEEQMAHLAEREPVLTLHQAVSNGHQGGVVVSFDDGYIDFHHQVLPILEKYRVPTVLYLATGLVAEERESNDHRGDAITWSQLGETVATGLVTVGAHTHSHADLSRANERTSEDEMLRSKNLIEDRLGVACRHFAYPFAVGSEAADRVARRLFDTAALTAWKTNRPGRTDPYRLGRTPVLRSDGHVFFRAKVRGLLDGEALFYRALGRGPWRFA
jgi:peptidoglycan/xylan/chitin deacetylase (PgdA/CDA1 family)